MARKIEESKIKDNSLGIECLDEFLNLKMELDCGSGKSW